VYQVLAYSSEAGWRNYSGPATQAVQSFRELTDAAALAVEPQRIEIVTLDRAMTIAEFAERYPSPLSVEEVARLNGATPSDRFEAGDLLKRVVGEPIA
jgi:predicted Zn-dependent protease